MDLRLVDGVEYHNVSHYAVFHVLQGLSTDTLGSDPREMEQHELQRVGQPDYSVTREQTA